MLLTIAVATRKLTELLTSYLVCVIHCFCRYVCETTRMGTRTSCGFRETMHACLAREKELQVGLSFFSWLVGHVSSLDFSKFSCFFYNFHFGNRHVIINRAFCKFLNFISFKRGGDNDLNGLANLIKIWKFQPRSTTLRILISYICVVAVLLFIH